MLTALLSTERSKDPKTQVGAVIVKDHQILSVGYNGASKGISDDELPWDSIGEKNGDIMQIKNSFVIHAEANALDHLPIGTNLENAILYVTLSPCHECAKRIGISGIKKVIYLEKYRKEKEFELSKYILTKANVLLEQLEDIEALRNGLIALENRLEHTKQNVRKIKY